MGLPNNPEVESALLGCVLLSPVAMDAAAYGVEPRDFFVARNAKLFEAMAALYAERRTIDSATLSDKLGAVLDTMGGKDWLAELMGSVPDAADADAYAKIIKKLSIQRQVIDVSARISAMASKHTDDPEILIAEAEALLAQLAHAEEGVTTLNEQADEVFLQIANPTNDKAERVFTGLKNIDGGMLGVEDSRFWCGFAVPGSGKTAFANALIRGVAASNGSDVEILYFHPEQTHDEMTALLLAGGTDGVPPARVKALRLTKGRREQVFQTISFTSTAMSGKADAMAEYFRGDASPKEIADLTQSAEEMRNVTVHLVDPSGWNIHRILATARRFRNRIPREKFMLVVFDGAHLIPGCGEPTRALELATITRGFKLLAQKYLTPGAVIVNTQPNRQYGQRQLVNGRRMWTFADIRDSGTWEQDADVVFAVERPSVWAEKVEGQRVPTWDPFEVQLLKNRQTSMLHVMSFVLNTKTMRVRVRAKDAEV